MLDEDDEKKRRNMVDNDMRSDEIFNLISPTIPLLPSSPTSSNFLFSSSK